MFSQRWIMIKCWERNLKKNISPQRCVCIMIFKLKLLTNIKRYFCHSKGLNWSSLCLSVYLNIYIYIYVCVCVWKTLESNVTRLIPQKLKQNTGSTKHLQKHWFFFFKILFIFYQHWLYVYISNKQEAAVVYWPSTWPNMPFLSDAPEGSDTFQWPVIKRNGIGGFGWWNGTR